MKRRPADYCYFAVAVLHLLALTVDQIAFIAVTKLLLMPLLLYVAWSRYGTVSPLYSIALVCSWLGDALLLAPVVGLAKGPPYFLMGMGAFLLTHLGYIVLTRLAYTSYHPEHPLHLELPTWVSISFSLVLVGLYEAASNLISDYTLRIGVVLYAGCLLGMVLTVGAVCFLPHLTERVRSRYVLALAGALAFLVSDAFIGASTFGFLSDQTVWIHLLIMSLYAAGQWGLQGLAAPLPARTEAA